MSHSEAIKACEQILTENNLYFAVFTLDEERNGLSAFNIPPTLKLRLDLLKNMDKKLRDFTDNKICIGPVFQGNKL